MTSRLKSQRTKARAIASATRAPLTRIRTFRTPAPGGACQKLLDHIQCCTISARRHLRQGGCGLRPGKSILTVAGGALYKRAVETAGATLSIKTDWNGFFAARYAPHCGASVNPRKRGQYIRYRNHSTNMKTRIRHFVALFVWLIIISSYAVGDTAKIRVDLRRSDSAVRIELLNHTPRGSSADSVIDFIHRRLVYEGIFSSGIGIDTEPRITVRLGYRKQVTPVLRLFAFRMVMQADHPIQNTCAVHS